MAQGKNKRIEGIRERRKKERGKYHIRTGKEEKENRNISTRRSLRERDRRRTRK